MNRETWKPIAGFPGYDVSNEGRVARGQKIKTLIVDHKGYLSVILYRDGKAHKRTLARVVAEAFIGPRPEGMVVCHNNGNKVDTRADNLRYDTPAGNEADKIAHGTQVRGERHHSATLTDAQVAELRARYRKGVRGCGAHVLAKAYGLSKTATQRLLRGWNRPQP